MRAPGQAGDCRRQAGLLLTIPEVSEGGAVRTGDSIFCARPRWFLLPVHHPASAVRRGKDRDYVQTAPRVSRAIQSPAIFESGLWDQLPI